MCFSRSTVSEIATILQYRNNDTSVLCFFQVCKTAHDNRSGRRGRCWFIFEVKYPSDVKSCSASIVKFAAVRQVKQRRCRCEVLCLAQCEVKCAAHFRRYFTAQQFHDAKHHFTCRKAHLVRKIPHLSGRQMWDFSWRRGRDSNPRDAFNAYTISSRAPSASSATSPIQPTSRLQNQLEYNTKFSPTCQEFSCLFFRYFILESHKKYEKSFYSAEGASDSAQDDTACLKHDVSVRSTRDS